MAKVTKEVTKIELIAEKLDEALILAKEEYQSNPSNPLYSVITDLALTVMELKKIK